MTSTLPDKLRDTNRLAALRRTALLDSPTEAAFDRLARLASKILQAPVALVSLVDIDRQFFKSAVGLPEPWASRRGTPLSHSFCQHVVASGQELRIENSRNNALVCDNLAVPELGVIAYAGIPLTTSDGHVLGSFCAIDHQPRAWTDHDLDILRDLAASVVAEIELRIAAQVIEQETRGRERALTHLRQSEAQLNAVLDNAAAAVTLKDREGRYLRITGPFREYTGVPRERALGKTDSDLFPPEAARLLRLHDQEALATGQPVTHEEHFPNADAARHLHTVRVPLRDETNTITALCTISTDATLPRRLEDGLAAALARDHHLADAFQQSLRPDASPSVPGLSIVTHTETSWDDAATAAAFTDTFALDNALVALAVGTLTRPAPAPGAAAELQYALRAFLRETPQPGPALTRLGRLLSSTGATLALSVLVINPAIGEVQAASAGGVPPLVLRHTGAAEPLQTSDTPLGSAPNSAPETLTLTLAPCNTVLLTTAAITDARLGPDTFGYDRLTRLAQQSQTRPLRQLSETILAAARAFAGGTLPGDALLLLAQRQ